MRESVSQLGFFRRQDRPAAWLFLNHDGYNKRDPKETAVSTILSNVRTQAGNPDNPDQPPLSYANYLYIRYDNGVSDDRSSDGSVLPGSTFWYSPDITFSPTDTAGNPVLGTAVTLEAVIHNAGFADAVGVFVEFNWFDPSLAIVETNKHTIGTKIVSVPHDGYTTVTCPKPWIPTFANGGHECLVVQCSCPGEGTNGVKHPYNASLDRHVGQRNVNLSPSGTPLKFALKVPNPFSVPTAFSIHLRSMVVRVDLRELNGLSAQAVSSLIGNAIARQPATPDGPRLNLSTFDVTDRFFNVRIASINRMRMKEHSTKREVNQVPRTAATHVPGRAISELKLDRDEMVELNMMIPPQDIGDNQFLVHQLTQVVKGTVVGGYSIIVQPRGFSER
jgi:hypothetical protein